MVRKTWLRQLDIYRSINSVLQTSVPDRLRGRVFSFYDTLWQAARLASIGAGGVLADALGIRAVYLLGGLILVVAGLWGWRTAPHLDGVVTSASPKPREGWIAAPADTPAEEGLPA